MEPSEQCSYDNDPNPTEDLLSDEEVVPVEETVIVETPETLSISQEESEQGPQVYSFSEVPPDAVDGYIELNGQQFMFERSAVDGEFYVLVPEGQVVTLECAIKDDEEEPNEEEDISHNIETHSSIEVEQQGTVVHEDSDNYQVEDHGDVKYLTIREVSNGVAYVQTPPDSFSSTKSLPEEGIKNEKLLNLAAVAQEIQSADAHSATADHIQDLNSPSLTEGSVIVSQIHPDTDSVSMYPNSETEEDTATDLASEHDSKSGFGETSTGNAEAEPSTVERRTSFSCISSTRTVDNTVSVIHTTSSTYVHDELEKDAESSNVSNDCNVKLRLDMSIVESEQSEDSVPDLHENLSQDHCSNQNDKFSNQDEDSVLSQNCGLDLTKESNIVSPSCEDSLPAVEHIRSRYGIMDALNKDKQASYYDINTSEDLEDTINSSSRSTNITEDAESVSENNSDDLECKNTKEVVSEMKLSPEKLSAEYDNSNSKLDAEVIEVCEKVCPITVQEFENVKEINNDSEDLLSKTNRPFRLPSKDNSNSKNSAFSENVSTPSLLTKELNSVQIDLSPRQKSKVVDAYDFDDSSTEADNDSNHQISVTCQDDNEEVVEEGSNPKVFATEINVNEDENTQKLTFQDALGVLDKKDTNKEECDEHFNGSSDLFNSSSELEENDKTPKSQEEIPSKLESSIPEQESVLNNNEYPEQINTEKVAFDEPCSSKANDEPCLMDTEESFVKTPKKTYLRKRMLTQQSLELFSCDDLSTTKDKRTLSDINLEDEKTSSWKDPDSPVAMDDDNTVAYKKKRMSSPSGVPSPILPGDEMEDDMESNDVQSKVSATYKRKRKSGLCPQVVRANRARSLRPRSSQTEVSLENGTVDTSLCDLEGRINSQEKMDTEEANWGAILLGTSFSSNPSSAEPPTPSSTSPGNSQRSRERKKPAYFTMANSQKSPLASGKQFDKLIKSSPKKVKSDTATDKKKILHDKVKKQAMSLCNNLSPHSARIHAKRGRPKTKVTRFSPEAPLASDSKNKKMSQIEILPFLCHTDEKESTVDENPTVSKLNLKYRCDQCSFTTSKTGNILMHLKLRCRNDHYKCDEVRDPNKLQIQLNLLRGNETSDLLDAPNDKSKHKSKNTKVSSDHWNGSSRDSIDQPSCSIPLRSKKSDKDKDDAIHAKKKFGFAKTDVVWVKKGRWHWPALVWDISDKDMLLYVIKSPNHCEPLKIASQSLEKMVHSFDDVEFSKTLLENAKKMNDHAVFFKAVQKADSYIRKKLFADDDIDCDPKTYFNIIETTDKPPRKKQPFLLENIDTDITTKNIDIRQVLNCIWSGKCDEHCVSINLQNIPSERHELFEKNEFAKELEDMSWFGPLKTDSDTQLKLYDHFYGLYKRNIVGPANISYIYKVWIPEAIIKAISFVNKISFDEAELIFLKQESQEDYSAL